MRINIPESAETMDIFLGVLANTGLIVLGTVIGCLFRSEKVKRVAERVFQLFALFVILMGVEGALGIKEPFKALIFMVLGTALGELIDIDKQMNRLGDWAQRKISGKGPESAVGDTSKAGEPDEKEQDGRITPGPAVPAARIAGVLAAVVVVMGVSIVLLIRMKK